jgi:hypothetical protein
MAEKRISIKIDETGKISAKTDGIKGEMCLTELEEILGEEILTMTVKKTDEYYQRINPGQKNIQKQEVGK